MSENLPTVEPSVYSQVFDVSPQGICLIDQNGIYINVNQSFAELLGYTKKELIGKSIQSVTHPDDLEMDMEMTEKVFSGTIDYFELDKRFIKKNGDVTWLKLHASTYQENIGIGILEPIKVRTKLEGRIAKLKQDLDQFIYRISHDIRGPVANILGLTALKYKSEEELVQFMDQARENAKKLDHIIREIGDYAVNERFSIKEEEISLIQAIDEICEEVVKEKSKDKKINIAKKVGYKNGIKVDHSRLNIILKNLITNAFHFSKEEGHIDVIADVENSELVVIVKDDGVGIRQDIQAKIYDMFYRGSNISEGAGLGLFIVKDVLKEINGTISFESDEGKGTEFTVKIPVSE